MSAEPGKFCYKHSDVPDSDWTVLCPGSLEHALIFDDVPEVSQCCFNVAMNS
jgi:hypothetical protein